MTAWYVVYTQPNRETAAQEHLRRQGYDVYLPQYRRWRKHARRRELVSRPLFPRYMFVALDLLRQSWRPILSTVGVIDLLRFGELPTPVPEGLVEDIRTRELVDPIDHSAHAAVLAPGTRVRVVAGPFADLVGRFCEMADRDRVYLLLDLLGRQVKTCLASDDVVPA